MSDNIKQRIGINIKALREMRGLSQEDLARRMNMARPAISNWENGKSEPSGSQLVQLAKIFNVSLDMLVGNSRESLKVVVVDTTVLMKRPVLIDELISKFDEVIVSDIVVSELNNLKDGNNHRKKQRAWLAMVNLQKRIDDKSVKYAVSPKKDGKNDERITAVALARAQESLADKVYVFSDDVWFSFLVKEQKQSNFESLTFVIYDEQFKDTAEFDPIKTQNFFSLVKSKKLSEAKNFNMRGVEVNKVDTESGYFKCISRWEQRLVWSEILPFLRPETDTQFEHRRLDKRMPYVRKTKHKTPYKRERFILSAIASQEKGVKKYAIMVLMRAGLPFGLGIADKLETLEKNVRVFFSAKEKELPDDFNASDYDRIILADAVIESGNSILGLAEKICVNEKIIFATNVLSHKAVAKFEKFNLYAIRVSQVSFTGSAQKTVSNGKGPDTGERLFNSGF